MDSGLEEKRELWEGQKGRRLSSSVATDKQAVAAYQWGSLGVRAWLRLLTGPVNGP